MPDNPILWLLLAALGIALLVYERERLQAWLYVLFNDRFPAYIRLSNMWEPGPRLSRHDMADFAEKLVAAVMGVQGAAVFVITPAYLANAIAEERERGTLELVLTMPLAN